MVERRRTRAKKKQEKFYRTPILLLLGGAILASFAAFVYLITRFDRIGSFVVSVPITDYREGLPVIEKKWESTSFAPDEELANFRQGQLVPLPPDGDRTLQNKEDVSKLINDIKSQMPEKDFPALVLLRCHALAVNGKQRFGCSLLIQEDESQYLLEDFLQTLVDMPSRDIVVLADICDLSFLPAEGILVNPIATSIRDTCEYLNETIGEDLRKSDRNLWIMCPSADGQISHRDRDGTTLFQSACRAAFDADNDVVTLDHLYTYVLSHVHEWSQGTQTPLLFSVFHNNAMVKPEDELAKRVRLSRLESTIRKEEPTPPKEIDQRKREGADTAYRKTETALPSSRYGGKFIRWMSIQDETEKTSSDRDNSSTNLQAQKPPATFRDYHERWKTREKSSEPWVWNGALFDALEYRLSFQNAPKAKPLAYWLDGSPTAKIRKALEGTGISERIVQYWENPSKLPQKYRHTWSETREPYVKYAAGVSEYLFWRNLVINLKEATYQSEDRSYKENVDAITKQFDSLSESLQQFRKAIPTNDVNGAVMAMENKTKSIDQPVSTTGLHKGLEGLVDELKLRAEKLTQPTKGKKNKSNNTKWTSVDESLLQNLITSPLLGAEPRKELEKVANVTSELKNWQLTIYPLLSTEKLNQILTQASPGPLQLSPQYWKNRITLDSLRVIEKLCGFNNAASPLSYSDGQSDLLERFKNYGENEQGNPFNAAINRWHFYHLGEMEKGLFEAARKDRHGVAGIIVSPVPLDATTLFTDNLKDGTFVELKKNQAALSANFKLKIQFIGATKTPERCALTWDTNIKSASGKVLPEMLVRPRDSEPWKRWESGKPDELRVGAEEIQIEVRLAPNEALPLDSYLEITKVDDSERLRIPIFSDANRIEVVFVDEANDPNRVLVAANNVLELKAPCFKETTAVYSCYLYNRLPRERTATVRFYKDKQMKQEFFSSGAEAVKLLAADLQKSTEPTRQKIQLTHLQREQGNSSYPKVLYASIQETSGADRPSSTKAEPIEIRFIPILPIDQTSWEITTEPSDLRSIGEVEVRIQETPLLPVKTKVELSSLQEPGYDKYEGLFAPNEVTKDKPITLKFPPILPDKRYLFAAQIGDYKRAKFFEQDFKATRKLAEVTRPGRLNVKSIEGLVPPEGEKPMIFPSFENGPEGSRSVKYSSLRLKIEADAPDQKVYWSIQNEGLDDDDTEKKRRQWDDRTFLPVLDTDGGNLSVRFDVSELNEEIQLESLMPAENETRRLILNLQAGSASWERVLIMDRKPPSADAKFRKSTIRSNEIQEILLSEGATFSFFIETQDEEENKGSGLREAYFEFVKSDQDRKSAVRIPQEFCSTTPTKDGFNCNVTVDMKNKFWLDHKRSDLAAYLVTIDKAGNEQLDHTPLKIRWVNPVPPKSSPATKPQ